MVYGYYKIEKPYKLSIRSFQKLDCTPKVGKCVHKHIDNERGAFFTNGIVEDGLDNI